MDNQVVISHVAVECSEPQYADRFFTAILGIPMNKTMVLSKELAKEIFNSDTSVSVLVYDNGKTRFEVFITPNRREKSYAHIGIAIDDVSGFIMRCKQEGLEPFFIKKDGKKLLFVRDFSQNLFEVKEGS